MEINWNLWEKSIVQYIIGCNYNGKHVEVYGPALYGPNVQPGRNQPNCTSEPSQRKYTDGTATLTGKIWKVYTM